MLNQHPLQPGRMDRASAAAIPQQPAMNADAERAPVTFGWWLYSQERFVGHYHLETLYRLDRVGARLGDHSSVGTLQPGEYYGQSGREPLLPEPVRPPPPAASAPAGTKATRQAAASCHRRMNTPRIGRLNFPQFEA